VGQLARSLIAILAVAMPLAAAAAPIGYWRFEVDDDVSLDGLSSPNELAFGTPMISSEATLDGSNLPVGLVPLSGAPNGSSVAARFQGGTNGINASAAWYAELLVTSITVEFWARTIESVATPFRWTSGGADGILITDPNSLDVTWYVNVGGTPTAFTMSNLANMDASWSHYAFSYDEASGVATFRVDGVVVQSVDGPDGAPLLLAPGTPVEIGVLMDYSSAGQGTIDELRLSGSSLGDSALLIPEPSTASLLALGLAAFGARRRAPR
jgi:Concanavalin A-like lectin/glucanases superfamily/PEP-CTERM motif